MNHTTSPTQSFIEQILPTYAEKLINEYGLSQDEVEEHEAAQKEIARDLMAASIWEMEHDPEGSEYEFETIEY